MEKHHDSGTTDRITQDRITLPSGWASREFIEKRLEREVHQEELSVSDDCTSLAQYLEKFTLPGQCIMDEKGLEEAGYDVLRGMSRENVCYAEISKEELNHKEVQETADRVAKSFKELITEIVTNM